MSTKLPIVLDSRAEVDLDVAAQRYAEQRSELALEFLAAVDAVLVVMAQFPQMGLEVAAGIRRVLTKKFPFCVYYMIDDGRLTVFAILHLRQSPDAWRQRLE